MNFYFQLDSRFLRELTWVFVRFFLAPVVEDESSHTSAMSDDEEIPNSKGAEFSTDSEHNLTCCIFMLDILLKQMELQEVEQHTGIHTEVCEDVCRLLKVRDHFQIIIFSKLFF